MIRKGTQADKKAIYDLYSHNSALIQEVQDVYFAKKFIPENTYINEINGHVGASLQINYHTMMLHNKKVETGVCFGQFYEKNKGAKYMRDLKDKVLKDECYKTLLTLVLSDDEDSYKSYGFEKIYNHKVYTISRNDVNSENYSGVSREFRIDELVKLYNKFTMNFDGYLLRDKNYFIDLLSLLHFKKYNLVVYYDEKMNAQGYMIYYIDGSKVTVKEIIYLNGLALTRLLCYALRLKNSIQVYVSQFEDFTKAYPKIKEKQVGYMLARINDFELFNRLFDSNISTNKEAMYLLRKPLFLTDENYC